MKTVCVDLDGVLAKYDGWKGEDHIGDPVSGAVRFSRAVSDFARLVVFTAREDVSRVKAWLDEHAFEYFTIVGGKPKASAYVDDRSVICRPAIDEEYDFDRALREARALVAGIPLGGTGKRPRGSLNDEDEGEFRLMISREHDCIRVDFGKPTAWVAFPREQAIQLANLILKHAKELP